MNVKEIWPTIQAIDPGKGYGGDGYAVNPN